MVQRKGVIVSVTIISGTGTDIGKTMVTGAIAALAVNNGLRTAVLKPVQTGVTENRPGDIDEIGRLVPGAYRRELCRHPAPLAPNTATRRAGSPFIRLTDIVDEVKRLDASHEVVLVEGAGGLLAWFDDEGPTLADLAAQLNIPIIIVAAAGIGTLNVTALTAEYLRFRSLSSAGIVIGSWPRRPDLAARCNVTDLQRVSGIPLMGALPEGMGDLSRAEFVRTAEKALAPSFGGTFSATEFARETAPGR
jgi:dethiobiotin synthetase